MCACCHRGHRDPASLGLNTAKQNGKKPRVTPTLILCRLCSLDSASGLQAAGRDWREGQGWRGPATLAWSPRRVLEERSGVPCSLTVPGDPSPRADTALQRGSAGFQPCVVETRQIWPISRAWPPCMCSYPTDLIWGVTVTFPTWFSAADRRVGVSGLLKPCLTDLEGPSPPTALPGDQQSPCCPHGRLAGPLRRSRGLWSAGNLWASACRRDPSRGLLTCVSRLPCRQILILRTSKCTVLYVRFWPQFEIPQGKR